MYVQIPPSSARERELQSQMLQLQQRYEVKLKQCWFSFFVHIYWTFISVVSIGNLVEELQRQKMKNVQVCALILNIYRESNEFQGFSYIPNHLLLLFWLQLTENRVHFTLFHHLAVRETIKCIGQQQRMKVKQLSMVVSLIFKLPDYFFFSARVHKNGVEV